MEKAIGISADFPNAKLYTVEAISTEWYGGILEYLEIQELPPELDKTKRRHLV